MVDQITKIKDNGYSTDTAVTIMAVSTVKISTSLNTKEKDMNIGWLTLKYAKLHQLYTRVVEISRAMPPRREG